MSKLDDLQGAAANAQTALTQAQDRLSAARDKLLRAVDAYATAMRKWVDAPDRAAAALEVTRTKNELDAARTEFGNVETDLK